MLAVKLTAMAKKHPQREQNIRRFDPGKKEEIIPKHNRVKSYPRSSEFVEKMPTLSGPIEFKDQPIQFKLFLDGREEEIKVVEPDIDLPLPEGARLTTHIGDSCIADLVFRFNPGRFRPYELHFRVLDKKNYMNTKRVTYGPSDKRLLKAFKKTIVQQGGIKADIEMSRGKARIHIQYLEQS